MSIYSLILSVSELLNYYPAHPPTQYEANSTVVLVCAASSSESPEAAQRGERLPRAERRLRAEGRVKLEAVFAGRWRRRLQRKRLTKQSGQD